eukprot:scaffold116605_cov36-Prasinocladus_malaysianus.AAC.2
MLAFTGGQSRVVGFSKKHVSIEIAQLIVPDHASLSVVELVTMTRNFGSDASTVFEIDIPFPGREATSHWDANIIREAYKKRLLLGSKDFT